MVTLWEIVSYKSASRPTTENPKQEKVNKQNKTPLDDGWMMYFYYILPCSPY